MFSRMHTTQLERILGTESDRDGVGKDINALEDGSTAHNGELDLLVRAAGKQLDVFVCLAADDRGRHRDTTSLREVVHAVKGLEER